VWTKGKELFDEGKGTSLRKNVKKKGGAEAERGGGTFPSNWEKGRIGNGKRKVRLQQEKRELYLAEAGGRIGLVENTTITAGKILKWVKKKDGRGESLPRGGGGDPFTS